MRKNKLLLLLALLMTAVTGAMAQSGTPSVKKLTVPDTWTGDMTTFSAADLPSDFAAVGDDVVTTIPAPTATGNAVLIYGFSGGETKYVEYANGVQSATDSRDFPRDQIYGYVNIMGYEGVYYTAAASAGYTVSLKDGVKDAGKWTVKVGEGQAQALPIGGLKGDGSETVTLKYNGRLKVKGVTATSDAPAEATPALSITSPSVGQVIGSDGKNYAYGSLPTGVTAVAKICYVSGSNGLALALTDEEGKKDWSTAQTVCAAHTAPFTGGTWKLATKDEWDNMINAAGSYSALHDGFSSVGGTNMQEDYYWSSTEYDSDFAWYYDGYNEEDWDNGDKVYNLYVRACLAFTVEQSAKPAATVTTAPTGAAVVGVGKTTELVSGGVADGGTLMYAVTTTNTKPTSTAGFSDAVPTAKDITASGKVYVWYYVKGDDTHSDSEIAATAIEVPVADIVWDATNVSDIYADGFGDSYEKEGVTLSADAGDIYAWWDTNSGNQTTDGISFQVYALGGFTFTAPAGKEFTKIVMNAVGYSGWYNANLGEGWAYSEDETNNIYKVTWTGSAASTDKLLPLTEDFEGARVKSIVFYLVDAE